MPQLFKVSGQWLAERHSRVFALFTLLRVVAKSTGVGCIASGFYMLSSSTCLVRTGTPDVFQVDRTLRDEFLYIDTCQLDASALRGIG